MKEIEQQLLNFVHLLLKTGISIDSPQLPLLMNEIITQLQLLETNTIPIDIPISLLECIDQGLNPDLLLKQQLQTIVDKNQKTHGRLLSIKLLHDELSSLAKSSYPDSY